MRTHWVKAVCAAVLATALPAAAAVDADNDFEGRLEAEWQRQLLGAAPTSDGGRAGGASTQSDAAGGCDGVKNGGFGFHTNQQPKPWWQVDLGAKTDLDRVVVYNRCTAASERAAKLGVMLGDDGKTWRTVYRHNGKTFLGHTDKKPLVVEVKGESARFVRIQLPDSTWLHLDEIEVYGPDDPNKNIALNKPADQSSGGPWSTRKRVTGKTAKRPKAKAAVPQGPYIATVQDVLASGALLAEDLRSAGVDTAAFGQAAAEIAKALKALAPDSPELSSHTLYFRARRAVRDLALENPVLDFDEVLLVSRGANNLGLPANWQSNSSLRQTGYDNMIGVLSDLRSGGKIRTLFGPKDKKFVGDVDLHFDATKMLFSMPDPNGQWGVFELDVDPRSPQRLRQIKLIDQPDVSNYDACYLPDGNIMFSSTAPFIGVPCVRGNSKVTNLYLLETASAGIRRLTFDQDHNWCPTVLNDGRVGYLRWEYSDLPHSNSRILFHMNPDGTGQAEFYGSNSFWPNGIFYARPIPGHPSKVVGIVTGHHGVKRMGELVIFDTARSRREADGVIQRIPGRGKKVEPIIRDRLVDSSWPKFLHPYPLNDTYFLVSCKPTTSSLWGIYLVDVFDNMVLLAERTGFALLEPIPLRSTPRPPIVTSRCDPERKDALVYLVDVYLGGGLAGVPRGAVKKLRLFTYHFSYHGTGGLLGVVGADGPWDIKRVLGTVPVAADGSAVFRVPANTPISVQPLDADGRALQIMRSWFVGMPGETVSCVGCHERQGQTPPVVASEALRRKPSDIEPWRGPVRGFSFAREVQPVVDKYCLGCHSPDAGGRFKPAEMPDLRGIAIEGWRSQHKGNGGHDSGKFSVGYNALARYVRRPGIESNIRMLTPMEFHAGTTELVQMLTRGHNGVKMDEEAWDRLITWIDLNAPYHGTWGEIAGAKRVDKQAARRREMMKLYAYVDADDEAVSPLPEKKIDPVIPPAAPRSPARAPACPDWPFDAAEARRRQEALGQFQKTIDLGGGVNLDLALVPAGEFVMGDAAGNRDEQPLKRIRIDRPFWMGTVEVTNEQFALFDPLHDSRVEPKHGYQFGIHGYPVNGPRQPVVRVSWRQAMAFCEWLSAHSAAGGLKFSLPTEAQWEHACRAGSAEAFSYGGLDADFSTLANVGDAKLREFASDPYTTAVPMKNPNRFDDWLPRDERFSDGQLVSADVGGYQPNAWGLHDMHGNVAEWTRTAYRPYPYNASDGRNAPSLTGLKVVRGGSWYDRPKRCRSAFRLAYRAYQPVYNVGLRVVAERPDIKVAAGNAK
ncbi:MAG TPA: SUMF1/EgtB/PvdO family nonheme iron enzyme [Phycisphaerae bacterium]|nr:SUMF1/EgtB/PvdO family nonheme iron enzyme [Phycisphaerae bacterium]